MIIVDPNGNETQSQNFQRNDCGGGSVGSWVLYTVPANTYHGADRAEANALALADIAANGQNYANANGVCYVSEKPTLAINAEHTRIIVTSPDTPAILSREFELYREGSLIATGTDTTYSRSFDITLTGSYYARVRVQGKGWSVYSDILIVGAAQKTNTPHIIYAPTQVDTSQHATFQGVGEAGALITAYRNGSNVADSTTTVNADLSWSLTLFGAGVYLFTQTQEGETESDPTEAYTLTSATLASCDPLDRPFTILSATYSGTRLSYSYYAVNLVNATWYIKKDGIILNSGTKTHTSAYEEIELGGALGVGEYEFQLAGTSCAGSASKTFTVASLSSESPVVTYAPTTLVSGVATFYGNGIFGSTIKCYNALTGALVSSTTVPSDSYSWSLVVSAAGTYKFTQTQTDRVESNPTTSYTVATETAVTCDNGANPFTITSVVVLGTSLAYSYDAANLVTAAWVIEKNGMIVQNGSTTHTSPTNTISIQALTDGSYVFKLSGTSCVGTASYAFQIQSESCPLPSVSIGADKDVYAVGDNAVLTATVSGATSYEWFRNGVATGNTTATLNLSTLPLSASGDIYKVRVVNACGGGKVTSYATSNELALVVLDPTIVSCDNGSRAFSLTDVSYSANSGNPYIRYVYDAANCVTAKWRVKKGATTVQQGDIQHNSNTIQITVNALADGNYTFTLTGTSCNGTTSKSFTVGTGETPSPTPEPTSTVKAKTAVVNYSPLPVYNSIDKQFHRRDFSDGFVYPIYATTQSLLPFQFTRDKRSDDFNSVVLVSLTTGEQIDITEQALQISVILDTTGTDYDVVMFRGLSPLGITLPEGRHYLKLSDGVETWYTEVMTLVQDTSDFLEVVYYDRANIGFSDVHISFRDSFKFVVWLPADLARPDYVTEEEVTKREGRVFTERQIAEKVFRFTSYAPEFLCDALRIMQLCDFVQLRFNGNTYDAEHVNLTMDWGDSPVFAVVEGEFNCGVLIKKIPNVFDESGSFDGSFNNDFDTEATQVNLCTLPSASLVANKTSYMEGDYVLLTLTATNFTSYVWYKNDTVLANTGTTLTLNNIPVTANNDVYKVVATNACGTATTSTSTSNLITLAVAQNPNVSVASLSNVARSIPYLTAYSQKPNWAAMRTTTSTYQGQTGHKQPEWIVIAQLGHGLFDMDNKPQQNGMVGVLDASYMVRGLDFVYPSNPDTGIPWSLDPYTVNFYPPNGKSITEFVGIAQELRMVNFLNDDNDYGTLEAFYDVGKSQALHEYFGKGDRVNGKAKGLFIAMDKEIGTDTTGWQKKMALAIGCADWIHNGTIANESMKTAEMYTPVFVTYSGLLDINHNRITSDYMVSGALPVGNRLCPVYDKQNPLRIDIPTRGINAKSILDYPCIIPTQESAYYVVQGVKHGTVYDLDEGKTVTIRKYGATYSAANVANTFNVIGVLHSHLSFSETFGRYCQEVLGVYGLMQDKPIYDKGANGGLIDYMVCDDGTVLQNPADKRVWRINEPMSRKLMGIKALINFMCNNHTHQWAIAGGIDGVNYHPSKTFDGFHGLGAVVKMINDAGGDDSFRFTTPLFEDTEYSLDGTNFIKTKGVEMNVSYTNRLPVRAKVGHGAYAGLLYVMAYREDGIEPLEFWVRAYVAGQTRTVHVPATAWETFSPNYQNGSTIADADKDYFFKVFSFQ